MASSNGVNNAEGNIGAKQYIRNKHRLKKKAKKNAFLVLKNDQNHFLNLVVIIVIWIAATLCYYLITDLLLFLKMDIFVATSISALTDIIGFLVGYVLYEQAGLDKAIFRSFLVPIVFSILLIVYMYALHGTIVVVIATLLLVCKLGISAATYLGYLGVLLVFRARIHGTALGLCLALAYIMSLFSPFLTNSNPPWVSMAFVALFGFFGAFISLLIKQKEGNTKREDTDFEEFQSEAKELISVINSDSGNESNQGNEAVEDMPRPSLDQMLNEKVKKQKSQ